MFLYDALQIRPEKAACVAGVRRPIHRRGIQGLLESQVRISSGPYDTILYAHVDLPKLDPSRPQMRFKAQLEMHRLTYILEAAPLRRLGRASPENRRSKRLL